MLSPLDSLIQVNSKQREKVALPGLPYCNLSVLWSLNEGTRERGSCVSLLSLPSLIEHDDFHLFPSACGGRDADKALGLVTIS